MQITFILDQDLEGKGVRQCCFAVPSTVVLYGKIKHSQKEGKGKD